ncbi:hypothetical protein LTR37_009256 [Vermiconidia calcicola]|uniref:Uncharacterized protein n=1 Tax=Vermiconidia calcicola TaxID=1690605 RepID=A0ACC3NBB9_9PEZI|nr:hypothetical protein LTR37_009256 [Vermiconidia calcicola]
MASQTMTAQPSSRLIRFATGLREALREEHPFVRKPTHPVPWFSVYAKRQLRTAGVLLPLAVVVFGWPFAAKRLVNWRNGVNASDEKERRREQRRSRKVLRRVMLQGGPVRMMQIV